ncbi:MAG: formate dehydrogenase subunit gamma [Planctomycetes bacterium]|nr:formate dehydrogenase subunit gamma [Planctomycetota bacterium]
MAVSPPPLPLPADLAQVVESALAAHAARPGALLPIFHAIQDRAGYVPREALPRIAWAVNQSQADVLGTLSFYHDFRTHPPGRHVVKLCRAEACQARGSDAVVADVEGRLRVGMGRTREDGAVTLEPVYCLGNCALGPSAMVDGRLHARATADRIAALVEEAPPCR